MISFWNKLLDIDNRKRLLKKANKHIESLGDTMYEHFKLPIALSAIIVNEQDKSIRNEAMQMMAEALIERVIPNPELLNKYLTETKKFLEKEIETLKQLSECKRNSQAEVLLSILNLNYLKYLLSSNFSDYSLVLSLVKIVNDQEFLFEAARTFNDVSLRKIVSDKLYSRSYLIELAKLNLSETTLRLVLDKLIALNTKTEVLEEILKHHKNEVNQALVKRKINRLKLHTSTDVIDPLTISEDDLNSLEPIKDDIILEKIIRLNKNKEVVRKALVVYGVNQFSIARFGKETVLSIIRVLPEMFAAKLIQETEDYDILEALVVMHEHINVRLMAMDKLKNFAKDSFFEELTETAIEPIRFKASEILNDKQKYKQLLESDSEEEKKECIRHISDNDLLFRALHLLEDMPTAQGEIVSRLDVNKIMRKYLEAFVWKTHNNEVASQIISVIDKKMHISFLKEIAMQHPEADVRVSAIKRLDSRDEHKFLARLARNSNEKIWNAIAGHFDSPDSLKKVIDIVQDIDHKENVRIAQLRKNYELLVADVKEKKNTELIKDTIRLLSHRDEKYIRYKHSSYSWDEKEVRYFDQRFAIDEIKRLLERGYSMSIDQDESIFIEFVASESHYLYAYYSVKDYGVIRFYAWKKINQES